MQARNACQRYLSGWEMSCQGFSIEGLIFVSNTCSRKWFKCRYRQNFYFSILSHISSNEPWRKKFSIWLHHLTLRGVLVVWYRHNFSCNPYHGLVVCRIFFFSRGSRLFFDPLNVFEFFFPAELMCMKLIFVQICLQVI